MQQLCEQFVGNQRGLDRNIFCTSISDVEVLRFDCVGLFSLQCQCRAQFRLINVFRHIEFRLIQWYFQSIIFGPLKTLPRSSKSCDCVTFGVLRYLLSTFLLYTPHCHMILSKQKCCLLSTGVSTESQKRTSVLQIRHGFLATRNMTHINVGLARSYVKLLLSSWKTYMCNLMAWYINK